MVAATTLPANADADDGRFFVVSGRLWPLRRASCIDVYTVDSQWCSGEVDLSFDFTLQQKVL